MLLGEKRRLRGKLAQCAAWAAGCDAEILKEYAATIKAYKDWLDRTQTIEELTKDEWAVTDLYNTLDPDQPSVDGF